MFQFKITKHPIIHVLNRPKQGPKWQGARLETVRSSDPTKAIPFRIRSVKGRHHFAVIRTICTDTDLICVIAVLLLTSEYQTRRCDCTSISDGRLRPVSNRFPPSRSRDGYAKVWYDLQTIYPTRLRQRGCQNVLGFNKEL